MSDPTISDVRERAVRFTTPPGRAADPSKKLYTPRPAEYQRIGQYAGRYSSVMDPRVHGSTWTNVKAEIDVPDRHELFLLADGERKVEMETVTRKFIIYFRTD